MENNPRATLKNVLTEQDLLDLLGLTKSQVSDLRLNKKLPFIKVNQNSRLYFEDDIIQFFYSSRVILNKDSWKEVLIQSNSVVKQAYIRLYGRVDMMLLTGHRKVRV